MRPPSENGMKKRKETIPNHTEREMRREILDPRIVNAYRVWK